MEADVWLFRDDYRLYVGHDTASLAPWRTFESLYVAPILELLNVRNPFDTSMKGYRPRGVFDQDPFQSLVLLVDFKTFGPDLLPQVDAQLGPLRSRDYLTYFNGSTVIHRPVTVIGTGNAPFDLMVANTSYRDIFFDAPLADMPISPIGLFPKNIQTRGQGHTGTAGFNASAYDLSNSLYSSTSFTASVGYPWWFGTLTDHQLELIRDQIRGAHQRGLQVRFWDTPSWPKSLRNYIWSVLLDEGADILNADDLEGARDILSGH